MTSGFVALPATDRSAIPAADLALLVDAIDRRRVAGLCGRHQHRSQSGCDAVMVWPRDEGAAGGRPFALFCRDEHGGYSAFAGDGSLMAAGSIADILRCWK